MGYDGWLGFWVLMGFLVFIAAALAGVVPEWLKDLIAPADEDSEKPP